MPLADLKLHQAKTILLLGPQSADKGAALLSLVNQQLESTSDRPSDTIQFCTQQTFLLNHLTVRENLHLMAAMHGVGEARVIDLLRYGGFDDQSSKIRVGALTSLQSRTLSLLNALIPTPTWLLIDNLAGGLSISAGKILGQTIRQTKLYGVQRIVYATSDLEAIEMLNPDEVWLLEDGKLAGYWLAEELPKALKDPAVFTFEFQSVKAAEDFYGKLSTPSTLFDMLAVERTTPHTVKVLTETRENIVNLTQAAGLQLLSFRQMPLEIEQLSSNRQQPPLIRPESLIGSDSGRIHSLLPSSVEMSGRQKWQVIIALGLNEWRRHFRSPWKGFNILFSNIIPLGLLVALLQVNQSSPVDFILLAAITLTTSAGVVQVWGIETVARLVNLVASSKVLKTTKPFNNQRATSLWVMSEWTPIKPGLALVGLILGQFTILLAHSSLLLFLFPIMLQNWGFTMLSGLLWFTQALTALVFSVFFGRFAPPTFFSFGLGLFLYLLTMGSVVALAQIPDTTWLLLTWFWPPTGFVAAYRALLSPSQNLWMILMPFFVASITLGVMGNMALRAFRRPLVQLATINR